MQVTVFGASGNVGQRVVERLLVDGHEVVAFVHSSAPFAENDKLKVVTGDVHDAVAVKQALQGSEAVISTLGSWHTPTKDILTAAMTYVIPAMQDVGINRIITLTGSAAQAPDDEMTLSGKITRKVFGLIAKDILQDGEQHMRLLASSKLSWTTLRASIITNGVEQKYHLNSTLPKAWETINRHTVAKALVDQLSSTEYLRKAPHLHARKNA